MVTVYDLYPTMNKFETLVLKLSTKIKMKKKKENKEKHFVLATICRFQSCWNSGVMVVGLEPRNSYMQDTCSTAGLHSRPHDPGFHISMIYLLRRGRQRQKLVLVYGETVGQSTPLAVIFPAGWGR